jgi:hypothetical protein
LEAFMGVSRLLPWAAVTAFVGAVAVSMAGLVAPAASAQPGQTGPVSPTPAAGTPELSPSGSEEVVRQLVQCGGTMFAVGQFTQISQGGVVQAVNNAFSFSASTPFTLTGWAPNVNGVVNSIAFVGGNCADAYLGGLFTSINGTPVQHIAEVDTTTGNVVTGFASSANREVDTLLGFGNRLIAGGTFTKINGSKDAYMASLDPTTGANDGFISLNISGNYQFQGAVPNPTSVYNQQLSPDGTMDLVEGDFTSAGGQPRQQAFILDMTGATAAVTGWNVPDFNQHCSTGHPFYVHAGAWSPGSSTVYFATTGRHPYRWNHTFPLTGLCDAAAAFPAAPAAQSPTWINYTGCWSLFSVAADTNAVYVGGHELYQNNPNGCKSKGPAAVNDPGLGGLDPATGSVLLNSAGTAGLYSRARGHTADDMLRTDAGLWVASDNFDNANTCGGVQGHAGICFLPGS